MLGGSAGDEDRVQLTSEENNQDNVEGDEEREETKMQIMTVTTKTLLERHLFSRHCTVCLYICLCLLLFGSVIVLIIVIVDVVLPFQSVHSFVNTTCTPIQLIVQSGKTCVCGAGCTAQYKCLSILISYVDVHNKTRNATVFEDEASMGKQVSIIHHSHDKYS